MEIVEKVIKDIITDYSYSLIALGILLVVVLMLIFIIKICSIASCQKAQKQVLERIAKVIEQESEPYVIERPEKKVEKKAEKKEESK